MPSRVHVGCGSVDTWSYFLSTCSFRSIDCGTVRLSQFIKLWNSVGILQEWSSTHMKIVIYTGNVTKYVCLLCKCPPNRVREIKHWDPKSQSNGVDVSRIPTGHHCCWKTFTSDPFVLTLGVAVKTSMEQWWNDRKKGKPKYGEKDWDRFFLFRFLSIYRQTTSNFAKHVFCYRVRIMQLLAIYRLYVMHKQNERNAFIL